MGTFLYIRIDNNCNAIILNLSSFMYYRQIQAQTEPPPVTFSSSDDESGDDSTMPGKLNNAAFSSLLSSKLAMGPPPLVKIF